MWMIRFSYSKKSVFGLMFFIPIAGGIANAESVASSPSVQVFTTIQRPLIDHRLPVKTKDGVSPLEVYIIDHIHRLQAALSKDLPNNVEAAKQQVLKQISDIGSTQNKQLENAATGLAKSLQYGIDRYPAIVFDGHVVLYGTTDLVFARHRYQQWLEASAP